MGQRGWGSVASLASKCQTSLLEEHGTVQVQQWSQYDALTAVLPQAPLPPTSHLSLGN